MKNNKWYVISTFVLGCIVINFAGRILSDRLQLPLWLDSFGMCWDLSVELWSG